MVGYFYAALLALMTSVLTANHAEDDFVISSKDRALLYIDYDTDEDALLEFAEEDTQLGHSLLEMDEKDPSLLPWSDEKLGEDISSFIERRSKEVADEFDDIYAYELPSSNLESSYQPTFENVPENRRHVFSRPKVIASKEPTLKKKSFKRRPLVRDSFDPKP